MMKGRTIIGIMVMLVASAGMAAYDEVDNPDSGNITKMNPCTVNGGWWDGMMKGRGLRWIRTTSAISI